MTILGFVENYSFQSDFNHSILQSWERRTAEESSYNSERLFCLCICLLIVVCCCVMYSSVLWCMRRSVCCIFIENFYRAAPEVAHQRVYLKSSWCVEHLESFIPLRFINDICRHHLSAKFWTMVLIYRPNNWEGRRPYAELDKQCPGGRTQIRTEIGRLNALLFEELNGFMNQVLTPLPRLLFPMPRTK